MSDGCGLPEVIETEQVVEIMDESQLLDFAASMETRGEMVATLDTPTSCSHFADSVHEIIGAGSRQLAGHKRRREYVTTNYCPVSLQDMYTIQKLDSLFAEYGMA